MKMATFPKWCFLVGCFFLIVDTIMMYMGTDNPLGLPLPCPITLDVLAVGGIAFAIKPFKNGKER